MIKLILALAYPFVVCSVLWSFLLQWSSTCWCEQRWELSVIIRVMEVPLH